MGQKRSYKQYAKEFKEEAVASLLNQGYTVAEAAKSLGVATNLLYLWKGQQEQLLTVDGLVEEERSDLRRLRKENKELRMDKDILKKASPFFAKEMK